jgi:O-antigen biosynthesis protein
MDEAGERSSAVTGAAAAVPRVSVVVSTYASEEFIGECLDDLANQSIAGAMEIIVVDAASPENERAVVEDYQGRGVPIRYIRTPTRIGVYAAWNLGLRLARAEYVTTFSTNDRLRREAYEILAQALDAHPEAALAYGNSYVTRVPHESFLRNSARLAYSWPEFSYEDLLETCLVGPHPMWRRSLHTEIGWFDESFTALGDQDFWLRIGERRALWHVPEFTGLYWDSDDALSRRGDAPARELAELRVRWRRRYRERLRELLAETPAGPDVPDPHQRFRMRFGFLPRRAEGLWTLARMCERMEPAEARWPYRVTALVSTYNAERFLAACLEDLEAQTIAGQLEIVVIDSGSEQNEKGVVEEFQRRFRNIVYLRTERETLYESWNRGVALARGRYITNANTDDSHRRDALERLADALDADPQADFAYADYAWSSEPNDQFAAAHACREVRHPPYHPAQAMFFSVIGCHPMWRRRAFDKVGRFDPEYSVIGDYEFLLRCVAAGLKPVQVPQILSLFFQNPQGLTLQSTRAQEQLVRLHRRYRGEIPIHHLYAVDPDRYGDVAWAWTAQGDLALSVGVPWFDEPHRDPQYAYDCYRHALDFDVTCQPALHNIISLLGADAQWEEAEALWQRYPGAHSPDAEKALRERSPLIPVHLERAPAPAITASCHGGTAVSGKDAPEVRGYRLWMQRHAWDEAQRGRWQGRAMEWPEHPAFHFVTVLEAGREALLANTLDSLVAQVYGGWGLTVVARRASPDAAAGGLPNLEWIETSEPVATAVGRVAGTSTADWLVLVEPGDRLDPRFAAAIAEYAMRHPQWSLIYTDEDRISDLGVRSAPQFKPDLNLERLRSQAYVGAVGAVRREALVAAGGFGVPDGVAFYDLTLRVQDLSGPGSVGHIADVLVHRPLSVDAGNEAADIAGRRRAAVTAHLARQGVDATVHAGVLAGTHFVEYRHKAPPPRVSIVIPTRDGLELLRPCLDSVLTSTVYPDFEIIVVDNDSRDVATIEYLRQLPARDPRVRVLAWPGEFNYAAINNAAAAAANGEYLLLLNNDTVIVQPGWLARLMMHGQRTDVGVVGARLIFLDQRLQHAGIVLGLGANGVAEHVHYGMPMAEPGHLGRAQVAQYVGAVTGACMLVKKSIYLEVGGMDERHLRVLYNDVDLCLRIAARGYGIVWTPFATVVHHGSASLRPESVAARLRAQQQKEVDHMLERWLSRLAHDEGYNRQLTLLHCDCTPETVVDARWDPVIDRAPKVMGLGFGSVGSWHYRVRLPLETMERTGQALVNVIPHMADRIRVPSVTELYRAAPTALLMHSAMHDIHLDALERYRRHAGAFVVFGLDDLLTRLPPSNPFAKTVFADMKQRLQRTLANCDRLVVTTEPLAETFRKWIGDIRVVPNYLDRSAWSGLRRQRRNGPRRRVGWAGAQQHGGDLRLLIDVVRTTAREIDWVFFGMCPEELRPYAAEVKMAVALPQYPAALAALDLDLAVAPLELNVFNEAKSNLRLLEYGALGMPVVCSDIEPYRGAPVTRVANQARTWVAAIRERIRDPDATEREGERLREWVWANWMLDAHIGEWLRALDPSSGGAAGRGAGRGEMPEGVGARHAAEGEK